VGSDALEVAPTGFGLVTFDGLRRYFYCEVVFGYAVKGVAFDGWRLDC